MAAPLVGGAISVIAGGEEVGACVDAMAGERLRRLDWDDARVERDQVVAKIGHDRFCALPELAKDRWPGR